MSEVSKRDQATASLTQRIESARVSAAESAVVAELAAMGLGPSPACDEGAGTMGRGEVTDAMVAAGRNALHRRRWERLKSMTSEAGLKGLAPTDDEIGGDARACLEAALLAAPVSAPGMDREAHKTMTWEEYAASPLKGWHEVRRDESGCVDVRYLPQDGGLTFGLGLLAALKFGLDGGADEVGARLARSQRLVDLGRHPLGKLHEHRLSPEFRTPHARACCGYLNFRQGALFSYIRY